MEIEIDNSAANAFRTCPTLYLNEFLKEGTGLEPIPFEKETYSPLELGDRGHQLMEEWYKGETIYPASANEDMENELAVIMAGYSRKYPTRESEGIRRVLAVERSIKVALPAICPLCFAQYEGQALACACGGVLVQHIYTGKMDLVVEMDDGKLGIIDHKFEKRLAKSNLPQKWAIRDQATLYVWAASKLYNRAPEDVNFIVNVLRRPSEKLQVGPEFPDRQKLERTQLQVAKAVRDISIIACEIEKFKRLFGEDNWPDHKENCYVFGQCDFYLPCLYGWSTAIRQEKFQPKKPYLNLEGVPIFQP